MGGEERKDYFAKYCALKASMERDVGVTYPCVTGKILQVALQIISHLPLLFPNRIHFLPFFVLLYSLGERNTNSYGLPGPDSAVFCFLVGFGREQQDIGWQEERERSGYSFLCLSPGSSTFVAVVAKRFHSRQAPLTLLPFFAPSGPRWKQLPDNASPLDAVTSLWVPVTPPTPL